MSDSPPPVAAPDTAVPTVPVTAVVVARGRTPFLPTTLRALAAQTRRPLRVLLVDVSPTADPGLPAASAEAGLPVGGRTPEVRVLHAPHARTFGDAVRRAVADEPADAPAWLWLLHDDAAPEPTALAELVRAVDAAPSVAVAGVKQQTWTRPARLLEVGVRTSRSGRRMTDVEPGEVDQGQHDGRDDVLGVGIAGALVRRDVWEALGGTDPALGPFGDGAELCRRARLAGHRVVVVPQAVVRHAQASYHGLRDADAGLEAYVDLDADGEPDAADPRRSYAARRQALLHQRLTAASLPFVPVVAVLAVLAAVVRTLVRIATKEPVLAAAEVAAPLRALGRPVAVVRARARARRTRRLPRRALRPLQADVRTVWRQWRDRRLSRAEARRVVRAPSELELRELAALALRRRVALGAVLVVLAGVTAVAFGRLIVPALGGERLVGGALLAADGGLGDLWHAATSGWVDGGLGDRGPADPLLTVLLPAAALAGGHLDVVLAVLLLGSVVLAGVGAWFAAGAATRSVGVRGWAAVVWAALPSLTLAAGQGRVGAVLVHVALPWLVLGLARAAGVQQRDVVVSGMATAARGDEAALRDPSVEEWPDPEAWARAGLRPEDAGDDAQDPGATGGDARVGGGAPAGEDAADAGDGRRAPVADDPHATPVRGTRAVASTGPDRVTVPVPDTGGTDGADRAADAGATGGADRLADLGAMDGADSGTGSVDAADGAPGAPATSAAHPDADPPTGPGPAVPPTAPRPAAPAPAADDALPSGPDPAPDAPVRATGSVAAAAGASLALALVVAGAPALVVPALLVLLVAALCAPRGRRLRLLLVAVPSLVLLGPLLVEAASRGTDGLRLLLADPGAPFAADPASPVALLLGLPADGAALVPGWLPDAVPADVAAWWPAAAGAALVLVALIALLRGAPQARAVRLGWWVAAVGLATAVVASRVVVGADDGEPVLAWAGSAVSFAAAGLLTAAVVGTRGVRAVLDRASFGWRQLTAALLVAVAVVLPVGGWAAWAWEARRGSAADLTTLDRAVVPAIGRQTQESQDAPRVLALGVDPDGAARWQLLRSDGPQVAEDAAAVRTRALDGAFGSPRTSAPDDATAEVEAAVAALSAGATTDVARQLAALAVADVLVPALPAGQAGDGTTTDAQARTALIGRLDATPGLERITEGVAGVIWRVQPTDGDADGATTTDGTATSGDDQGTEDGAGTNGTTTDDGTGTDGAVDGSTADDATADDATADDAAADDATDDAPAAPEAVAAWARLLPGDADPDDPATFAAPDAVAVPSDGRSVDTTVDPGDADRLLVLAERSGPGWRATLDGRALPVVSDGWRQTFELGAAGGHLVVEHRPADRVAWTVAQAVVGGLALLLALPVRRRRAGRR